MEHSDYSMDDMVSMCGFKDAAAFNKAFKFSFGITPTEYLHTISQIFKNKV
jgi:transcriptional regulator GlxA family with amidase domain